MKKNYAKLAPIVFKNGVKTKVVLSDTDVQNVVSAIQEKEQTSPSIIAANFFVVGF